ncbi:hypothetical protein RI367_008800 [Sorochytrium milnesiophthora]
MQLMLGLPPVAERWVSLTGKFLRHVARAGDGTMLQAVRDDSSAADAPLLRLRKHYGKIRKDDFDPTTVSSSTFRLDQHRRLVDSQLATTRAPNKPIQNAIGVLPPPAQPCWLILYGDRVFRPEQLRLLVLWRLGRLLPYVPCAWCGAQREQDGLPLAYTTRRHIERCLGAASLLLDLRHRVDHRDLAPDGYLNDVLRDGRCNVTWIDVAIDAIEDRASDMPTRSAIGVRVVSILRRALDICCL